MLVLKDMLVHGSIRGAATTHRTDTQVGATMAARAITMGVLGILTGHRPIPIMATIHPGRLRRMDTIHMGAIRIPIMEAMPTATRTTSRGTRDRKSTRLNSSHVRISYAVFCLKKKKKKKSTLREQKEETKNI